MMIIMKMLTMMMIVMMIVKAFFMSMMIPIMFVIQIRKLSKTSFKSRMIDPRNGSEIMEWYARERKQNCL